MGGPPSEEEECTADQLACLKHRLDLNLVPYCDFAVFTAYSDRLQRRLKMSGLALQPDGTLKQSEVTGPASFSDWEASYRVLRTAVVELEAVCPSHLDLYRDHIFKLVSRYGQHA
eukprot:2493581-Amphidinium_carterae.1